jgi:putative DNA primase/helicase
MNDMNKLFFNTLDKGFGENNKKRYVFITKNKRISEEIILCGYSVLLAESSEELKEVVTYITDNAPVFTTKDFVIIGCCVGYENNQLEKAGGSTKFIDGYNVFANKEPYYTVHTEEIGGLLADFLKSLEVPNFMIGKTIDKKAVAEYTIKHLDIINLDGDIMQHSESRIYANYTEDTNDKALLDILDNSSINQRKEIYPYIERYAPKRATTRDCIAFKNGVYDLNKKELKPYAEDMYFSLCIPHNYNPEAVKDTEAVETVKSFFNAITCENKELEKLLFEIIAYCFIDGNPWQKTFFLYGSGGNGKGTFFQVLTAIFGADRVANMAWQGLLKDTERYLMVGKSLIICDDVNNTYMQEPQILKQIASCEPITVKSLYKNVKQYTFKGKLISSGNDIPRVNDTSNGWQRRLITIPFGADFRNNPDVAISKTLTAEPIIECIIARALYVLPKVLDRGFTAPKASAELLEEYRLQNNPVASFVAEYGEKILGQDNEKSLKVLYTEYQNFCDDNGYKALGIREFGKRLRNEGLEKRQLKKDGLRYYHIPVI